MFSMYATGLAVECILRAFKLSREPTFDEKHDLLRLFKASGMLNVDPDALKAVGLSQSEEDEYFRELQTAVTVVYNLWGNDYRFASEERLRTYLKKNEHARTEGVKGDILKANALVLLRAAETFLNKGVIQWHSLKKSKGS